MDTSQVFSITNSTVIPKEIINPAVKEQETPYSGQATIRASVSPKNRLKGKEKRSAKKLLRTQAQSLLTNATNSLNSQLNNPSQNFEDFNYNVKQTSPLRVVLTYEGNGITEEQFQIRRLVSEELEKIQTQRSEIGTIRFIKTSN